MKPYTKSLLWLVVVVFGSALWGIGYAFTGADISEGKFIRMLVLWSGVVIIAFLLHHFWHCTKCGMWLTWRTESNQSTDGGVEVTTWQECQLPWCGHRECISSKKYTHKEHAEKLDAIARAGGG